jgi:predicted Zn-dependent peptidase
MPGATEFCGVTVNVGSRDELLTSRHGLAHFVEHTIFKGTNRRTDSYIINRMEAVGGELNAYTTKEETSIYSAMPAGNYARATALIAELVTDSIFPTRKIDLEREVICDEIDTYLDSPADAVFDLFDEEAFRGNSLAHNILGTKDSVMAIDSDLCCRYLSEQFTAPRMVYFYAGPAPAAAVMRVAQRAFAALPSGGAALQRTLPQPIDMGHVRRGEGTSHQSHTVMGAHIGGLHSPQRFATALAVNILGGPGMNALLNVALRERRGLVYSVDASTALYTDCGLMTIYFGCDHDDTSRCIALVNQTLERLASDRLTERKLQAYKRQYIGQVTVASDNKEQVALSTARCILHGLEPPQPSRTAERLRTITPDDLRDAAATLTAASANILTLA